MIEPIIKKKLPYEVGDTIIAKINEIIEWINEHEEEHYRESLKSQSNN